MSQVFKPILESTIPSLPHELQEKIYTEVWQGLAQAKSQQVYVELLCREINKRKVQKINGVKRLWVKGAFIIRYQFRPFTFEVFNIILGRFPEWQWSEITYYVDYVNSQYYFH